MELKHGFLTILILGLSLFSNTPSISANPYWVPDSSVGSFWTNSTIVQMPFAEVLIQIDYLGQSIYDIDFLGEYTIQANETKECTLAYAFPSSWTEKLTYYNGDIFNITFDDTQVSTWSIDFENASWIQPWGLDKLYHISCDPQYVAFNVSFQADVNHTLRVSTAFRKIAYETNYLDVSYVCGTAVSFMGSTKEKITIIINEFEPLYRIEFIPSTNLSIINENNCTIAVWDLLYPAEYWPVYDPVDAVYAYLEPYDNETISTTPEDITSTTPDETHNTHETTTPNILGPIAVSGTIGLIFAVATIVIWKSKKL